MASVVLFFSRIYAPNGPNVCNRTPRFGVGGYGQLRHCILFFTIGSPEDRILADLDPASGVAELAIAGT